MNLLKSSLVAFLVLLITFGFVSLGTLLVSASDKQNEQRVLLSTSDFGYFRTAQIIKKSGRIKLEVWKPYVQHVETRLPQFRNALLGGPQELILEYDEMWISTDALGVDTLYWNNGRVQALTGEKLYTSDPVTGVSLAPPAYKIIIIHDRNYILRELRGN